MKSGKCLTKLQLFLKRKGGGGTENKYLLNAYVELSSLNAFAH